MSLAAFFVTPFVFATSASVLDLTVEFFRGGQIPCSVSDDGLNRQLSEEWLPPARIEPLPDSAFVTLRFWRESC